MRRILVIGATSNVGRQVIAQVPTAFEICAFARNPETAALTPHAKQLAVIGDAIGRQLRMEEMSPEEAQNTNLDPRPA